jgi:hypothetical protein
MALDTDQKSGDFMPTREINQSDAVGNWPQPEMTWRQDRLPLAVAIAGMTAAVAGWLAGRNRYVRS